ncbi:MAG: hypothetical protein KAJ18_06335 [Candidatus Omnitrophica bacterium]|nr:hypothetical protein [Candidatus Omnitrophota bacterium]
MFRKLMKNKKAQQTAEYALLISLVVAAVIAMQTYAQRTIQARVRDASSFLVGQTSALGATNQYEPYYLETSYEVYTDDATTKRVMAATLADGSDAEYSVDRTTDKTRAADGSQVSTYDTSLGLINGI